MITDEEMLRIYQKLQAIRRDTFIQNRVLRPSTYVLPNHYPSLNYIHFGQMASGFTRGLIGEVNRFFIHLHHADCWVRVISDYEENDKCDLLWEFAEPMLELSVERPCSIRDHFSFALVHLLNQANLHKRENWKDELPSEKQIDYNYLKSKQDTEMAVPTIGAAWKQFPNFWNSLNELNDKAFIDRTQNFRHLLQHRFRLQFETGLTTYIERTKTEKGAIYDYKIIPPLQLETLIPDLYSQQQKAVKTFEAYWQLLDELCTSLGAER